MTEPVTIGIGSNKWVKEAATKMMTLYFPASSGTLSLHDNTGTDYQVPVGKKFVILKVLTSGGSNWQGNIGTTYGYYELWDSTVADTASGNIILINTTAINRDYYGGSYMSTVESGFNNDIDTFIEVAATKFITPASNSVVGLSITITGIETDV
jgi:hypothetical protein